MELIAGIDLGTTNSLIGIVEAGFPILLADEEGSRLTPSVVHVGEGVDIDALGKGALEAAGKAGGVGDERCLVGRAALRMAGVHPGRTFFSIKRFMGHSPELETESPREPAWREISDIGAVAEGMSALILRHLKQLAEKAAGQEVRRAVITVPAYFNDAQRNATKRAGELAGFQVERILNEPTAAALAYGIGRSETSAGGDGSKIAVYDFGGGTFDVSILELADGVFQVLSTNGDTHLGGDDIDRLIADWAWDASALAGSLMDQDALVIQRVLEAARKAKEKLSEVDTASISVPFVHDQQNLETSLKRNVFDRLIRPLLDRTRACCIRALGDAGLDPQDLEEIILVGGSSRIPSVQSAVESIFGRAPNLSQHPDEAVALGATIQAGILSGALSNIVLLDVTPLSLGIETFGGLMNVIIPRNTTIPAKAGEMFTNAVSGQESMRLRVLQGEREMARDNWELGQVDIPFTPGAKGSARMGVQFSIDENGILTMLARDTQTMKDHHLRIESAAVDVRDEAVEAMISESVDHAFEDMSERIWTEARLKAEELLPAVRKGLDQVAEEMAKGEIKAIEEAILEVRAVLEGGSEDAQSLRASTRRLDQLTEPMAALLVERAMLNAMSQKDPE